MAGDGILRKQSHLPWAGLLPRVRPPQTCCFQKKRIRTCPTAPRGKRLRTGVPAGGCSVNMREVLATDIFIIARTAECKFQSILKYEFLPTFAALRKSFAIPERGFLRGIHTKM